MAHIPLALAYRSLVPVDAEPAEVGLDRLGAAVDVACCIRVVDPQEEAAIVVVGEPPVRNGAQRTAEVQRSRGARGEADSDHGGESRLGADAVRGTATRYRSVWL